MRDCSPLPLPTNIVKISGYYVIYEQPLGCFVRAEFKWQRCCWWIWRGGPCGKLWLIFVSLAPLSNFANTEKKSQNRFHFQREVCDRQDTLHRQKVQCWTYSTILSKPQAINGQQQQRTTPPALNMSRKKSSKSAKKQKYPNSLKHLALVPQLISILRGSVGRLRPCQNFCQKGWSITRQLCGSTITMSTDGNKLSWEGKYILLVTIGYIYRH